MTRLGDIQKAPAGTNGSSTASSRLRELLERDLRGEYVRLPLIGDVWLELLGHDEGNAVEGATLAEMQAHGLPPAGIWGLSYEGERAKRTLARACRETDKVTPIGTLEQWGKLDDDVIIACWHVYGDVRERLDPVGVDQLTTDDVSTIDDAIEKKNKGALLRCGVAKLSLYLLTTADRRAISQKPPSSLGES